MSCNLADAENCQYCDAITTKPLKAVTVLPSIDRHQYFPACNGIETDGVSKDSVGTKAI